MHDEDSVPCCYILYSHLFSEKVIIISTLCSMLNCYYSTGEDHAELVELQYVNYPKKLKNSEVSKLTFCLTRTMGRWHKPMLHSVVNYYYFYYHKGKYF